MLTGDAPTTSEFIANWVVAYIRGLTLYQKVVFTEFELRYYFLSKIGQGIQGWQ